MPRPIVLDLFCGAGGAAMGYHRAGFDVVGVDIEPQPRYPFHFIQADAMNYAISSFDLVHASPPCQPYSATKSLPRRDPSRYPDLVAPLRDRLIRAGVRYVIENTPQAPLINPVKLCGTMFGLRTRRHRLFETWPALYLTPPCNHNHRTAATTTRRAGYYTSDPQANMVTVAGHLFSLHAGSIALDIDWMRHTELRQAIPPAYTEYIGRAIIQALTRP